MEKILIPVIANCDIEESIPYMGIGCKKGDVFMFDPNNEIHYALQENGCFTDISNDKCIFICKFPNLNLGKIYQLEEEIDIKDLNEAVIKNLCTIGYIEKRLKPIENVKNKVSQKIENKTKDIKKKIKNSNTFVKLAKELNLEKEKFKTKVKELLDIEIKDMRKKISANLEKKIKKALKG